MEQAEQQRSSQADSSAMAPLANLEGRYKRQLPNPAPPIHFGGRCATLGGYEKQLVLARQMRTEKRRNS
jgi:hypothetical protein